MSLTTRRRRLAWLCSELGLAVVFAWFLPTAARAQGFTVFEQGACAMGRTGAGVAAPCDDGSAMFFNPAGLASSAKGVFSISGAGAAPRGQFTDDHTGLVSRLNDRTFPLGALYVALPIKRVMVGVGAFAPYGLITDWPDDSQGRFLGYYSSLKSIYIQPTVAVRVNDRLSIGGGLDFTHVTVELKRHVDLSVVPIPGAPTGATFRLLGVPEGTDFGDARLKGNSNQIGGHVGAIFKASDRLSFGGRYLFRQHADIDGELRSTQIATGIVLGGTPVDAQLAPLFADGQALGRQDATTRIALPDQLMLGAAIQATPRMRLFIDYQYSNWSLFDEVVIDYEVAPTTTLVQSFEDAHGLLIGGEYSLKSLVLRGGAAWRTAVAPDQSVTPLQPEARRALYGAGIRIPVFSHLKLDVAYEHARLEDRRGRTTDGGLAVPTADINNGVFHYYGNLFGASLVFPF